MDSTAGRKERLERLLGLAQAYRGWSRKKLSKALGRAPTKIVPGSGVPKLDLVVELADALDWPVSEVVAAIWEDDLAPPDTGETRDFESLDDAARRAHRSGEYRQMIHLARQAFAEATTPDQRARACNREAGGWDGLGRYTNVLQAVRRGTQDPGVAPELRRMLQSNLANAYYTLWELVESESISQQLIHHYDAHAPGTARDRKTQAFAHYVSGHTYRRLISIEPQRSRELAGLATRHLKLACDLYGGLSAELDDESLGGIANTCSGGIVEAEVELGRRSAADALDHLSRGLDDVPGPADALVGDCLESYGWRCIFACNIALRHVSDEHDLQQYLAVFSNKAQEIADRIDNWTIRERIFSLQYTCWKRAASSSGFDIPYVLDTDDVRVITGAMGRFPSFRETGWRILRCSRVVNGGH